MPGGVDVGAEAATIGSAAPGGVFELTLWPAHFRFWPVFDDSGSESLLLDDVDPEDDVSDVSDL